MTLKEASGTARAEMAFAVIAAAGYRLTPQRKAVVSCLLDGAHAHTVENIRTHLTEQGVKANARSVYATLDLLKKLNLAHDYLISNKHQFELTVGREDHIHLCDDEGRVVATLPISAALRKELDSVANQAGFEVRDAQINIHAVKL